MVSEERDELGSTASDRSSRDGATLVTTAWLGLVSASGALAATVILFDRTTITGITRLWLASLALCFAGAFVWWTRPVIVGARIRLSVYQLVPLMVATSPLVLASLALVAGDYLSDSAHNYLFAHFYYGQLLSGRDWPVMLLAVGVVGYALMWGTREFLLRTGEGVPWRSAAAQALVGLRSLLPVGLLAFGLLLATVSLSMINVNFWRYWATADGWAGIGHYPSTFIDALHVEQGNVSRYFISFPLLPSTLTASFALLGHNTLASYLPMILASALLPLAVFLCAREATGDALLAFLFAAVTGSFPLLRSYTLDVAEADGLLMTTLVLATYFGLRARRKATIRAHVVAGFSAGIAALARPEGILYVGAMYAAAFKEGWRDRRFWFSVSAFGAIAAGFSAITLREFGVVWPGNHSGTLNLSNAPRTLEVVQQSQLLEKYASALGLSAIDLTLALGILLIALFFSGVQMLRHDPKLVYMPLAALGNVAMVFFVGPIPAEAGKFHDFFRHISYGFPLLAITLAYGVRCALQRVRGRGGQGLRIAVAAALASLTLAQMSLLAGPVTPGNPVGSPLMTSDVHVSAAGLLANPYPLPVMEFRQSDSRYVPDAEDYMAVFPEDVNGHYAQADIRLAGNAVEYYGAARVLFLGFLGLYGLSALPSLRRRAFTDPMTQP